MDKENFISILNKDLFPIVPLFDNSKIPNVKWSDRDCQIKNKNEFEDLSLRSYKRQVTGFSLLTGKSSDIIVIDIDKNHGDGSVDGEESFKELIKNLSEDDKNR